MKKMISFLVKAKHKKQLQRLAKREQETLSEYLRKLIEKHLEGEK